mmetsp:Transcript_500/g.587  ORF Transcript_500/g.587 Transcript_500/m.587 type:complete len:95 (+) Transcript_500:1278-1562(+)
MPRSSLPHHSEDFKIAAVRHYKNVSQAKMATCRVFKCSERSLTRWIERYDRTSAIRRQNRPPISYKITKEQVDFAVEYLHNNQTASTKELHAVL